jgi:thiol-disulfide isomerase/thioredoxin
MLRERSIHGFRMRPALLALIGALVVPMFGQTQPASQPTSRPTTAATRPVIYDPAADGKKQIAAALESAKRENRRVLVMFGGNWCGWCQRLHALFKDNKQIAKALLYEYDLVLVDIGRFDKQMDIPASYDIALKRAGVPFLTVLDADGKVVANQDSGALEEGDHHNPEKVLAFLNKWKAEPRDAERVVAETLRQAAAADKRVFLHLGAPWCPWCRKLDAFLAQRKVAELLARDFVDLKIDVDRMTKGPEVAKRFRPTEKGGIPWFAVLDAQGKVLTTSDGPEGNIGFPSEPEDITFFSGMLKKNGKRLSAAQLGQIEEALRQAAKSARSQSADKH